MEGRNDCSNRHPKLLATAAALVAALGISSSWHETAQAMSNRGVLRAMSGDMIGAARDFREATAMSHTLAAPERNLAHIEANVANRLAMTETR